MSVQERKSANAESPFARRSLKAPASRPLALRLLVGCLALAAGVALALPGAASADSFSLLAADVAVDVQDDGSLGVSERIQVAFSGDFTFGYRDIRLRDGETLINPSVAENGVAFQRGNETALETRAGPPGTFGVEQRGDSARIVWYFDARNQTRAFTVSYTLRGVAVAYDDVVDVNLKVWGDQWDEQLDRLVGIETRPGRSCVDGASPCGFVGTSSSWARARPFVRSPSPRTSSSSCGP